MIFKQENLPSWLTQEVDGTSFSGVDVNGYCGLKENKFSNNFSTRWATPQTTHNAIEIIKPIDAKFIFISKSKTYHTSGLMIYKSIEKNSFFVLVQLHIDVNLNNKLFIKMLHDNGSSLEQLSFRYNEPCLAPSYISLGEYTTLTAVKNRISEINKKHIQPLIDAAKIVASKNISDKHGTVCKTVIGSKCIWNQTTSQYETQNPKTIHIGDFVVNPNRLYRGWIWMVEQEDITRQNPLRIIPVFCGLEQVNFNKRRMCVKGAEIDHVDTIAVGMAFQNLKNVVGKMMKMKSGQFNDNNQS